MLLYPQNVSVTWRSSPGKRNVNKILHSQNFYFAETNKILPHKITRLIPHEVATHETRLLGKTALSKHSYQWFNISLKLTIYEKLNSTPWPESASELYRPSDRRLSAKLVPTFADIGCHVVRVTDLYGRILGFLDRNYLWNFIIYLQTFIYGKHMF
jgi:hypothetical protein